MTGPGPPPAEPSRPRSDGVPATAESAAAGGTSAPDRRPWWQTGIIYQVYPRSFQDSNGDGIGDLPGIVDRLDYMRDLGIDAIWLSPIYLSPMVDFGYDVADYRDVDPIFGTLDDLDRLVAEAHRRHLRLILDLVPNHTSDRHPWFMESRSSRQSPRRDWYIWRDPAPDGGPPNNWLSYFGGPAWTLDEPTGQYYLHQFAPEQPELNYRHPDVLPAMEAVMRFWLGRGVDGFRVDVIWLLLKDEALRDEAVNPDFEMLSPILQRPHHRLLRRHSQNLPEVHDLIRRFRQVIDEYDDRVMIGEIYLSLDDLMAYYGRAADECHLPYNFHLILEPWEAPAVRRLVEAYEAGLPPGAWPNWVIGNHDQHRVATRIGPAQARIANMLLLTLRGTPTTYYGEELGLRNVAIPADRIQDPPALNQPELADVLGRDPVRTPMPWDPSENGGFTAAGVRPWLPLGADAGECNVAAEDADPGSMLVLYRALTALRRAEPALHAGEYETIESGAGAVFAYVRRPSNGAGSSFLVVLNLGTERHRLDLGGVSARAAEVAVATGLDRRGSIELAALDLEPDEGLVLRLA